MRKIVLLITLTFASIISAEAQEQTAVSKTVVVRSSSMEQKIVKDSTGAIVPYAQWHQMMISGGYTLRSKGINSDTMTLVKMNAEDIARRNNMRSRLPAVMLPPSPAFPIGEKKELFSAKDVDGNKVDFKALAGKVIVLNFWFIACEPCKQEIPELNKLVANNPDVVFIGIGLDLKYEIKDFLKVTPFNYRQIYDAREDCNRYGINSYPTNVVIDKKGVTRYSSSGFGGGSLTYLKKTIEEVTAEN
ncbi:TlpA disulfide reductase family protein [Mucilaginibacter sp.]|uniref:TlpA family protein disulfide reductase n=1 Tax=Mucilaginibacter sp. TaxID=1882438 RepID=UPI003266AA4A